MIRARMTAPVTVVLPRHAAASSTLGTAAEMAGRSPLTYRLPRPTRSQESVARPALSCRHPRWPGQPPTLTTIPAGSRSVRVVSAVELIQQAGDGDATEAEAQDGEPPAEDRTEADEGETAGDKQRPDALRREEAQLAGALGDL